MKRTRNIPVIITLAAASISCIISLLIHSSFTHFLINLALSVLIFGILGIVLQVVIERIFPEEILEVVEEEQEESEAGEASSSIQLNNEDDDEDE